MNFKNCSNFCRGIAINNSSINIIYVVSYLEERGLRTKVSTSVTQPSELQRLGLEFSGEKGKGNKNLTSSRGGKGKTTT